MRRCLPALAMMFGCGEPAPEVVDTDPVDTVERGLERFGFPLLERERFEQTVGVDHDPEDYPEGIEELNCLNYDGRSFPWCYDEHTGTDFLLVGGFDAMDAGSATILAAAAGIVIEVEQDQYDRCHATTEGNDCDGYPMVANKVVIEHPSGTTSSYFHMMKDEVWVEVGDEVDCGEALGLVGSSGNSSTPHLHFGVEGPNGKTVDPYAGAYSQARTWWDDQGAAEGLPEDGCTSWVR